MRLPLTLLAAMTVTGCVTDAQAKGAPRVDAPQVEEAEVEVVEDVQVAAQDSLKERIRQVLVDAGQPEYVDPCPPCGMG